MVVILTVHKSTLSYFSAFMCLFYCWTILNSNKTTYNMYLWSKFKRDVFLMQSTQPINNFIFFSLKNMIWVHHKLYELPSQRLRQQFQASTMTWWLASWDELIFLWIWMRACFVCKELLLSLSVGLSYIFQYNVSIECMSDIEHSLTLLSRYCNHEFNLTCYMFTKYY